MSKECKSNKVCKTIQWLRVAFVVAVGVHILDIDSKLAGTNARVEDNQNLADRRQAYMVLGVNRALVQIYDWAQTVEERLQKPETKTQETK